MQDHDSTAHLRLGNGQFTLVDAEDLEWLSQWNWNKCGRYVARAVLLEDIQNGLSTKRLYLHRMLTNAQDGEIVDHINSDPFDNRKCNLRVGTQSQNLGNRRKFGGTSSQYKGVTWAKQNRKWVAQSKSFGKTIYLGYFEDEIEAALAYDRFAKDKFGDFARLNFPENH